jgi:hypothetical protein
LSPDGKFVLRFTPGDASRGDSFVIYEKRGNSKGKKVLSTPETGVASGFAWVPHRSHTLVFDMAWDKKPYIGLWNGGKVRVLMTGSLPDKVDPDGEWLWLIGVSKDGRTLIYGHVREWLYYDHDFDRMSEKERERLDKERTAEEAKKYKLSIP